MYDVIHMAWISATNVTIFGGEISLRIPEILPKY